MKITARSGPPVNHDPRCEDFFDPEGYAHAHDLKRCPDAAVVGWGHPPRWVCLAHFDERLAQMRKLVETIQASG